VDNKIYYIDKSVLVENRPLVKFIRHYIRDSSGVSSISSLVRISMMSFPAFTLLFVRKYSFLYNKKKITRWLEDMNFIFSCWKTIFYSLAALVRKILLSPLENKIHIFAPPCNILYICICICICMLTPPPKTQENNEIDWLWQTLGDSEGHNLSPLECPRIAGSLKPLLGVS